MKKSDLVTQALRRIAELDTAIDATETLQRERQLKRKRLVEALKVLEEELPGCVRTKRGLKNGARGKKTTTSADQPENQSPLPESKFRSMSEVIKTVILDQTGEFTTTDIIRLVRENHATLAGRLPKNYVATQLWLLTKRGVVKISKPAAKGGANTYTLSNRQKEKPAA